MLKLILMESIFLLLSFTMGKPVPGQKGGIIPPDSDLNLVSVSVLVGIAALAVLGVAVAGGVVHRSASGKQHGEKMFRGLFFRNLIMHQTSSILIWRQRLKKNLQPLGKDSSSMLW